MSVPPAAKRSNNSARFICIANPTYPTRQSPNIPVTFVIKSKYLDRYILGFPLKIFIYFFAVLARSLGNDVKLIRNFVFAICTVPLIASKIV